MLFPIVRSKTNKSQSVNSSSVRLWGGEGGHQYQEDSSFLQSVSSMKSWKPRPESGGSIRSIRLVLLITERHAAVRRRHPYDINWWHLVSAECWPPRWEGPQWFSGLRSRTLFPQLFPLIVSLDSWITNRTCHHSGRSSANHSRVLTGYDFTMSLWWLCLNKH